MTPSVLAMLPGPVIDGPVRGPDPVSATFAAELDRAVAERPGPSATDERRDVRSERADQPEAADAADDAGNGDDAAVRGIDDSSDGATARDVDDSHGAASDDASDTDGGSSDHHTAGSDAGSGDSGEQGDEMPTPGDMAFAVGPVTEVAATEGAEVPAGPTGSHDLASQASVVSSDPANAVIADVVAAGGETPTDIATTTSSGETSDASTNGSAVAADTTGRTQPSALTDGGAISYADGVEATVAAHVASGPVVDDEAQTTDAQVTDKTSQGESETASVETDAGTTTGPDLSQDGAGSNDAEVSPELLAQRSTSPRASSNAAGQSPTAVGSIDARVATAPGAASSATGTSVTGRADQPAMRASIERVMATLDVIAKQPPPRVLTLDLTELHGVRVTLSLDEGSVNVSVTDSGAGDAHARQWQDQLDDLLDERSFGSGDSPESTPDTEQNQTSTDRPSTSSDELRL